jgi:2'-5' RNA ligase
MGTQGLIKRTEKYNNVLENIPAAYIKTLRMNEYLLVINPNEELRGRIMKVKQDFAEKYAASMARFLKPHITLVNFMSWDLMEEKIAQRIKHVAMGTTPFKVELKDYGSFPSHTIYLDITTKIPIVNLVKELRSAQRLMKADPAHEPHFITEPHMTIARKLLPWQYEKGWLEYSHKHFTGKFIADSILLLKRPVGSKAYQILDRYEFQNLPVATRQPSLFA